MHLNDKKIKLIAGNQKHYNALQYSENLWEVMMKIMPWEIKSGNKNFDSFFLGQQLKNGKVVELNYTDEETKSFLMTTFLTDIMTYGFNPKANIK